MNIKVFSTMTLCKRLKGSAHFKKDRHSDSVQIRKFKTYEPETS